MYCVTTVRGPHCLPAVTVDWRYPDSRQPVGTSDRTGTSVTASVSQTHDRALYPRTSSLESIQNPTYIILIANFIHFKT